MDVMEELRDKLTELIEEEGQLSKRVLNASQLLDELIIKSYEENVIHL